MCNGVRDILYWTVDMGLGAVENDTCHQAHHMIQDKMESKAIQKCRSNPSLQYLKSHGYAT